MTLEQGARIAEQIIKSQTKRQQALQQAAQQQATQDGLTTWTELPHPAAYYYQPHKFMTVPAGKVQRIYDFVLRRNRVFWIMQLASNWWDNTWSEWKIDGSTIDTVYRWISNINTPLIIKDRYLIAYKEVEWIVHNDSNVDVIAEVLIDGVVYHIDDWKKMNKVGQV